MSSLAEEADCYTEGTEVAQRGESVGELRWLCAWVVAGAGEFRIRIILFSRSVAPLGTIGSWDRHLISAGPGAV